MLKGTLDDFTLADVFRLLSLANKTGKLEVQRSAGSGRVFFRDGEIYYADSTMTREPLGKKLIRARAVTETQLMKALDQAAAGEGRVGDILVASGVATTEQLQGAVKQQIEDAVFEMLRWDLGEFSWDPRVEADVEVHLAVSVENLIMEASRRLDELELIKRKIPSEETVPGMAPSPPEGAVEINITPEEWRILVLIDGQRTVREIAEGSGWDGFVTMRTLYGLVSAGLVEVLGPRSEPVAGMAERVPGFEATTASWTSALGEVPAEAAAVPEAHVEAARETPITLDRPERTPEPTAELREFPSSDAVDERLDEGAEEMPAPIAAGASAPPASETPPPGDDAQGDQVEGGGEPFLSDLLRSEPEPEAVPAAQPPPEPEVSPEAESPEPQVAAAPPVTPSSDPDQIDFDKAAMARELSGLFRDDHPEYDRPLIPGEGDASRPPRPPKAPPVRKRVEDDEQVTRGLISRLIDGVKGL
ncbi:MAG: DUF4388 domain-containing protein [Actinomycetota bacterium]